MEKKKEKLFTALLKMKHIFVDVVLLIQRSGYFTVVSECFYFAFVYSVNLVN